MSRPALLLVLCVSLLAACGEEPDDPPRVFDVKAPRGSEPADFPGAGMSFTRPANWKLRENAAPGVFQLVSGKAVVAGWAYPREEPLPETEEELVAAKDRLVDAIEERDPDYRLDSAVVREFADAPAIDISGRQVISKLVLRIHSVHVFKGELEYVIEAIAPPPDYALVDDRVMAPLLESLELSGELPGDAG